MSEELQAAEAAEDIKPDATPAADPAPDAPASDPEPSDSGLLGSTPEPTGDTPAGDLLGSTPDDSRKVEVQAEWPEDWRDKLSGGDDKLKSRLERFSDPSKIMQSWLAAEQKISSGEYKKGLDGEASEEQVNEWREANGVPADPNDYKLPEVENHEWNDADKELFGKVFGKMHETNASQAQIEAVVNGYAEVVDAVREQQLLQDKQFLQDQEDLLRSRLGDEYRPQLKVYERVLQTSESPIPESVREKLAEARAADGSRLVQDADMAQFLIELGLDHFGTGAMLTGDEKAVQSSRMAELKHIMNTDINRYWAEGLDQEYNDLLTRQAKRGQGPFENSPAYFDD